ncbi:MAG: hemolysin III family protein [Spartobacteria bacterium]|nr:hemolysin III family protein [Spartobacteria bacterium]
MQARSPRDELANSVTHGIAAVVSVACLVLLVVFARINGTTWHIVSFAVYGTTLVLLFTASTLYHAFRSPRVKRFLHVVDHASIYLLIAGTYTPILLGLMRGVWGWTLFGCVWGVTLVGIILKCFFTGRFRILSTAVYLGMGWMSLVAIRPLLEVMPPWGLFWLAAGGALYSVGVVFYAWKKLPYGHAVWHLFVFAASLCHFVCIMFYVLPWHT